MAISLAACMNWPWEMTMVVVFQLGEVLDESAGADQEV